MIIQRRLSVYSDKPAGQRSAITHNDMQSSLEHIIAYTELLTAQAQSGGNTGFLPDLKRIRSAAVTVCNLLNSDVQNSTAVIPIPLLDPALPKKASKPRKPVRIKDDVLLSETEPETEVEKAWILVVDDDSNNRDILSRSLGDQNHRVEMADSANHALVALRAREFDLVLLDVQLLGKDGYSVLQQLKADEELRHIPVIVISALNELDSVVRCIELGAEDYLSRPFEATLLKARIGSCLDKKRAHDGEMRMMKQLRSYHKCLQELDTFVAAL